MILRIATRRSPLARWQADHVATLLRAANPGLVTELVTRETSADLDLSRSIAEIGGKGAFSKEIQQLVLIGQADIAVHSAKDLQAVTPEGLVLGAIPERGTVHDCLVGARLDGLPAGATVGTGSARRRALLLDLRPDLKVDGLRGNIATRLERLDQLDELDAIVMAAVALERLGAAPEVIDHLPAAEFVPQVGQGALAVECRDEPDVIALLAAIDHTPSRMMVEAERAFLSELGGDCDLPAGANAELLPGGDLLIRGVLAGGPGADDGPDLLRRAQITAIPAADPGRRLARRLLAATGADATR
jgi:hydroxymethylbilane synthase